MTAAVPWTNHIASPDRSRKQATFVSRVPVHCITPFCSDAPNLYPPCYVWTVMRERESWARFNFYFYTWPFIHCLYFIYARKIYVRSHGKITWQCKSTLTQPSEKKDAVQHETRETSTVRETHERKITVLSCFYTCFLMSSYLFSFVNLAPTLHACVCLFVFFFFWRDLEVHWSRPPS